MDNSLITILKARLWRIIHQLEAQAFQSFQDSKHEIECVASSISSLSCEHGDQLSRCLQYVMEAMETMETVAVTGTQPIYAQSCPITGGSGLVGRPTFVIPVEHLEFLLDSGFKLQQMADMCGVSKRTMSRRLAENGMSVSTKFSTISDDELDQYVITILHDFPNIGYRSVKAHINSKGHFIQEIRVREAMRRVDVEGVLLRQMTAAPVRRRTYNVLAPNSLWHIDGYHKLIR